MNSKQSLSMLLTCLVSVFVFAAAMSVEAGTIGGGNQGRCEMLASETTQTCTGKGRKRTCEVVESYCGASGNDGTCSCAPGCELTGTCCADYAPVCLNQFGCNADSQQIAFLHVGGMCSTKWDYSDSSDRLADVSMVDNAVAIEVKAVQTGIAGTQVSARTLGRYLDACCTDSNSCIIYNYSNGDNVVGYALDRLATTERVCTGKKKNRSCVEELAWNILEVRTAAGNGGGSELSDWDNLASLFSCDLASQIGPSKIRNLYDHNNTRGVPVYHIGGFLDASEGSDDATLDAGWLFLPWHSDGAVSYHSSGARNTAVEWCGDGNNLVWDWDYGLFGGFWCAQEDLCSSDYGTLFQGHSMAFCPMTLENSDHYDQKMRFIELQGQ